MMSTAGVPREDWRQRRRQAGREAIVDAAWSVVRQEGFGSLSMRDLAKRAGVSTPTLYAYFESKDAIFDAMFARGNEEFAAALAGNRPDDPSDALRWLAHLYVEFCTDDIARYQLLFQRPVPDFQPSTQSYALALQNLEAGRGILVAAGLGEETHLEVWTALTAGIVSQQVANDPGGSRWRRHIDEVVDMYLEHYVKRRTRRR